MVKKVEPQLEGRKQEPSEYLPAVVKTNEEQESATRPEVPKFQSNRNTRAEGGRKDPDGDRDMPAQDGVERENGEIVLFNQERQDGDLSHERDGNKNASPRSFFQCSLPAPGTIHAACRPSRFPGSFSRQEGRARQIRRGKNGPTKHPSCTGEGHPASPCGSVAQSRRFGEAGSS